jgi:hypothetical protein
VYGIDIDEVCQAYSAEQTDIFIGDQEDRNFWREFKARVPQIDILVDDGGHLFNQQIVTLEEMLPHIKPGGIFLCEDVYGTENGFSSFCQGLTTKLYSFPLAQAHEEPSIQANALQKWVRGIYFYPYVAVIEKVAEPVELLPRNGMEPFGNQAQWRSIRSAMTMRHSS